jgi:hypothetical protein
LLRHGTIVDADHRLRAEFDEEHHGDRHPKMPLTRGISGASA